MAHALAQLEQLGLISTPDNDIDLVQTSITQEDTDATPTADDAVAPESDDAMEKYLEIAKQLVKLDKDLPTLKLCMADVTSGKYTASDAAKMLTENSTPEKLTDPSTGKPIELIIDGKAPNLLNLEAS